MGEKITRQNIDTFVFKDMKDKVMSDADQSRERQMIKGLLEVQDKALRDLVKKHNFDLEGARKAGYTDEQIMTHLTDK